MEVEVREVRPDDLKAIGEVIRGAFAASEWEEIVELAERMHGDVSAEPCLHLLAAAEGQVIGQVMFSRAWIEGHEEVIGQILAPLSVAPAYQGLGVGSKLVRTGLERLRVAGVQLVFVLGDPRYYGRFGFVPAGDFQLEAPQPIPAEYRSAWRVVALEGGVLPRSRGLSGRVRCAQTLEEPRYW